MSGRLVSPTMVGRDRDVERARGALQAALTGAAQHLVIAGEAGVGKSRLAAEIATLAEADGMRVLRGACANVGEGGLPYGPFVEILRALARELPAAELEAVVGPDGPDLARLVPSLSPVAPAGIGVNGEWAQARMLDAILGVVQRLSDRTPLLIVIEDLHWADPATRDTAASLVRTLRTEPVVLLLTVRSDELHRRHPLRPWLAELERTGRSERFDLERLDVGATNLLASAILGRTPDPQLIERVHRRSDGNPFFVEELLAAEAEDGVDTGALSPTLRDILLTRLATLPDTVQPVLSAAAVAGGWVEHGLLAAVTRLSDSELEAALRMAVEQQVLITGSGYRFRHALLQEAAYDDLLPGERQRLHRAYASALAERPVTDGAEAAGHWGALAHHWSATRDDERAFEASIRAGQAASSAFAFADARRHDECALELWPAVADPESLGGIDRAALLDRAARAAWLGGDPRRAVAWFREAVAEMPAEADPIERGIRMERLSRGLWVDGQSLEAMAVSEAALAIMPVEPPTAERARVLSGYGQLLMLFDRSRAAIEQCQAAIEMARLVGARQAEGHARNSMGLALCMTGRCQDGIPELEAALDIAHAIGDPDDIGRGYVNLAEARSYCGDTPGAMATIEAGVAEAESIGVTHTYGYYLRENGVDIAFELGRPDIADRFLADWRGVDRVGRQQYRYGLAQSIQYLVASGKPVAAERLDELRERVLGMPVEAQFNGPYRVAAAEHALWSGDPASALAQVMAGLDELATSEWLRYPLRLVRVGARGVADLAEVARARRDPAAIAAVEADAAPLWAHLASLQERLDSLAGGGAADEVTAELATIEAERTRAAGEPALGAWETATASWRRRDRPYLVGYALWRTAEAALQAGDRATAADALTKGAELARRLEAQPLLVAIEGLAARSRLTTEPHPASPTPAGRGPKVVSEADRLGLTRREREVLVLVGQGWTNRQIAESLFISENTAGVHVSNILGKLGATTRTEAASIAVRLGIAGA